MSLNDSTLTQKPNQTRKEEEEEEVEEEARV